MIIGVVLIWNAILGGYGENGDSEKAFAIVHQMQMEGPKPNWIAFLNLLNAYGALEELKKFHSQGGKVWED